MKKVCVQGLGFVGAAMSTAAALAENKHGKPLYSVVGLDLNNPQGNERIKKINDGKFPFTTSDRKLKKSLKKCVNRGNLRASNKNIEFQEADIIIVDVPFDIPYLDDEPKLNFTSIKKAIGTIGKYIKPGALIIIETTVPPGTCEKIILPHLEKELIKRSLTLKDIKLSHSYERVMPGANYLESITDFWRVFSGMNKSSSNECKRFLKTIINTDQFRLTELESLTASETAKVLENTYRAVNIAFIDEWTKFSEKVGIDLFEIIDAIKIRPTHSNIMSPGLGVGGYCLTKDPSLAQASSKKIYGEKLDFPFSKMAMKINDDMPMHTTKRISELLKGLKNKQILICGVSYRQDIGDTRYSPVERLYESLKKGGAKITCHDPYLNYWDEKNIKINQEIPLSIEYDGIILTVPHKEYRTIDLASITSSKTVVLDANKVLSKRKILNLRKKKITIESIGRANSL
jgi:nucleotide sugar dehydrogenase